LCRMNHVDIRKLGWVLSLFFAVAFAVSFLWTYTLAGDLKELQINLLKVSYLKFSGLDGPSFILGLVQSFVWGWIAAAVFGWLWNRFSNSEKPMGAPPQ